MKKYLPILLIIILTLAACTCTQIDGKWVVNGECYGDLNPCTDSTYDVGAAGLEWAEGHFEDFYITDDLNVTDDTVMGGDLTGTGTLNWPHHTTHELGGADAIKLDDLSTPDDNTDLNASAASHGLMTKQSGCSEGVYWTQYAAGGQWVKPIYTEEAFDIQGEFDTSIKGPANADATVAFQLKDADGGFTASDVGRVCYNRTDYTYATVTGFVDAGTLTLSADIMVAGENYIVYLSRFVADEDGYYLVSQTFGLATLADGKRIIAYIYLNGAAFAVNRSTVGGAAPAGIGVTAVLWLDSGDYIEGYGWHDDAVARQINAVDGYCYINIFKLGD